MQFFTLFSRIFESKQAKKARLIESREKLRENYRESLRKLRKSTLTQKEKTLLAAKLAHTFKTLLDKLK